jgi:hypothetical protein
MCKSYNSLLFFINKAIKNNNIEVLKSIKQLPIDKKLKTKVSTYLDNKKVSLTSFKSFTISK